MSLTKQQKFQHQNKAWINQKQVPMCLSLYIWIRISYTFINICYVRSINHNPSANSTVKTDIRCKYETAKFNLVAFILAHILHRRFPRSVIQPKIKIKITNILLRSLNLSQHCLSLSKFEQKDARNGFLIPGPSLHLLLRTERIPQKKKIRTKWVNQLFHLVIAVFFQ